MRPCQPMFCRLLQKSCFFISRWFSLFLTTKTPEKQHIRPRSTIHHTHHIITAWEPGSCVSPLGLEMESAENRGQKNIVNITILQFWFCLFFNFLRLSLHFFFNFYEEREWIFDLNTCFARLNCFKVDEIKERLSKPETGYIVVVITAYVYILVTTTQAMNIFLTVKKCVNEKDLEV